MRCGPPTVPPVKLWFVVVSGFVLRGGEVKLWFMVVSEIAVRGGEACTYMIIGREVWLHLGPGVAIAAVMAPPVWVWSGVV